MAQNVLPLRKMATCAWPPSPHEESLKTADQDLREIAL